MGFYHLLTALHSTTCNRIGKSSSEVIILVLQLLHSIPVLLQLKVNHIFVIRKFLEVSNLLVQQRFQILRLCIVYGTQSLGVQVPKVSRGRFGFTTRTTLGSSGAFLQPSTDTGLAK